MNATPIPMREDAWLANRNRRGKDVTFGASDMATIAGVSFGSCLEMWGQKTERLPSVKATIPMRCGHALEPLCAELYEEQTGRKTRNWGAYTMFQSPDLPYLYCTPDLTTIPQMEAEPEFVVEGKTSQINEEDWRDDKPPLAAVIQNNTQMGILGLEHGSVMGLIKNREFFWVDILFDAELNEMLLKRLDEFRGYVIRNEEPPADFTEHSELKALKRLHPNDNGSVVELDPVAHLAWGAHLRIKESIKDLEKQLDREDSVVVQALGNATFGRSDEMHFISYKTETRKGVLKVDLGQAELLIEHGIPFKEKPESVFRVLRKTTKKTIEKEAK